MKRKLSILFIFIYALINTVHSQEVKLTRFNLSSDGMTVLLNWELESGSVCNGMTIFRSLDNLNFEEIGDVPGVCGSSAARVPYNYIDSTAIINKINYYKIRLGYSQFSDIKHIFHKYVEPGKVSIKPNPSYGIITLEFYNENNENYTLLIFDESGKQVYFQNNIREGTIFLDGNKFSNQNYFFRLSNEYNISYNGILLFIK